MGGGRVERAQPATPFPLLSPHLLLPKLLLHRLALNRHPQPPANGPGRLRQNRQVGRAPTPPHGAAPAVEQGEAHAVLAGDGGELLLDLVQAPRGGEAASVFAGIRVADHALLLA
mgnify:CR=1 FL=1